LNSNIIQTKETKLFDAARKYFGGWPQAVEAAGLDYSRLRKKKPMRSWTKDAIANEIIRRSESGLSIRGEDVSIQDLGLYQAAKRHFGRKGWAKARLLAGFDAVDPKPSQKWNEHTVCAEIKNLHENGVALNTGALQGSSHAYILGAGRVIFGSWKKAIRAAGLDYSKIRIGRVQGWWTKPRVLMAIRNLERRGIRLSSKSINLTHGALFSAAVIRFKSWSNAVEAAGIDYRKHCRSWSTKAWLRRMKDEDYQVLIGQTKTHAHTRRNK
jgi:hypothetical protein